MKSRLQQIRDVSLYAAGAMAILYEFIAAPFIFHRQPNFEIVALGFGALGLPEFLAKGDRKGGGK